MGVFSAWHCIARHGRVAQWLSRCLLVYVVVWAREGGIVFHEGQGQALGSKLHLCVSTECVRGRCRRGDGGRVGVVVGGPADVDDGAVCNFEHVCMVLLGEFGCPMVWVCCWFRPLGSVSGSAKRHAVSGRAGRRILSADAVADTLRASRERHCRRYPRCPTCASCGGCW